MGLRRRVKFARPWLIADHFDDDVEVFLDAGSYTLNKPGAEELDDQEVMEIAEHYKEFVQQNIDRITMFSEFDVNSMGREWLDGLRDDVWNDFGERFLPVWHAETGADELDRLASRYARVGVLSVGAGDQSAVLNSAVGRYGVKLHGISMTKLEPMRNIKWDSVGSLSWLNPLTNGNTIIWTGRELKWYPKNLKDQARKRHRSYLTDHGFDAEAIAADDTTELLRLSLWSWEKFMDDINGHKVLDPFGTGVTNPPPSDSHETSDTDHAPVDRPEPEALTRELVVPRDTRLLPVIGISRPETDDDEESRPVLEVDTRGLMACDTCYIKTKCPGYQAGAACLYEIPVEITTMPQLKKLRDAIITIQSQRVLRMTMFEQVEGGYADANLSGEIDRLNRLIKTREESEREGFTITQTVTSSGEPGMLSRMFGQDAADKMSALPAPQDPNEILDADVVESDGE